METRTNIIFDIVRPEDALKTALGRSYNVRRCAPNDDMDEDDALLNDVLNRLRVNVVTNIRVVVFFNRSRYVLFPLNVVTPTFFSDIVLGLEDSYWGTASRGNWFNTIQLVCWRLGQPPEEFRTFTGGSDPEFRTDNLDEQPTITSWCVIGDVLDAGRRRNWRRLDATLSVGEFSEDERRFFDVLIGGVLRDRPAGNTRRRAGAEAPGAPPAARRRLVADGGREQRIPISARRREPSPPPGEIIRGTRTYRFGGFLALKWSANVPTEVLLAYQRERWDKKFQWIFDVDQYGNDKELNKSHCLPHALEMAGVPKDLVLRCCGNELIEWKYRKIQSVAKKLYRHNFFVKTVTLDKRKNTSEVPALPTAKYPLNGRTVVKICFYKKHWFAYDPDTTNPNRTLFGQRYKLSNIFLLDKMIALGILESFTALDVVKVSGKINEITKFRPELFIENAEIFVSEDCKEVFDSHSEVALKESGEVDEIMDQCAFFDCESYTGGDAHSCYLVCCWSRKYGLWNSDFDSPLDPCKQFLDYAITTMEDIKIIYAHNLWYDSTFLIDAGGAVTKVIMKNRIVYELRYFYKEHLLIFRDTLPIIQASLRKACAVYLSDKQRERVKKEHCPFSFIDGVMANKIQPTVENALEAIEDVKDREEFLKTATEQGCINDDNHFDYKKYTIFYCSQDCRVLGKIWKKFVQLFLNKAKGDIRGECPFVFNLLNFRTASAISYTYFQRSCMTGDIMCYQGVTRRFIQESIVGGRVMVRDNKPVVFSGSETSYILDLDAVSLYPSAMKKLWLPIGRPLILRERINERNFELLFSRPEDRGDDGKFTSAVLHITKIDFRKHRHFPIYGIKEKSGGREWKNISQDGLNLVVNAIDVWNMIDSHDAAFEADFAIVWKGKDMRIRDSITKLFELRKANHNSQHEHPIQLICKMMMNSCYGKSGIKPESLMTEIVPNELHTIRLPGSDKVFQRGLDSFLSVHAPEILNVQPFGRTHTAVKLLHDDTASATNILASDILAMARRIINQVAIIIEDLEEQHGGKTYLYYTDTDSLHVHCDAMPCLEREFKARYGRELVGEEMGQFHNDFDVPGKALGSVESYFLAKKVYYDKVAYIDAQGKVAHKDHVRMKGIPSVLVNGASDYEKLWKGETIEYDLAKARPTFVKIGGHIVTKEHMTRKIKIRLPLPSD